MTAVSSLDGIFLELEDDDPAAHMHIGAILPFDPLPGDRPDPFTRVEALLHERLDALPRLRQRLSEDRVGGLAWPSWVDDDRFDLAHHVHRVALPQPCGAAELDEWSGDFFGRRLNRSRPLWEAAVIERLDDGGWALAIKLHHCVADGLGSLQLAYRLLGSEPAAPPPAPPQRTAASAALREGAAVVRGGADALAHPRRSAASLAAGAELLARERLAPPPQTSVNGEIGSARAFTSVTVPLRELRAISRALGGTVTDALLATVAGALRTLLTERGERCPHDGLRAMVPVDIRAAGSEPEGNHISSLFVALPVALGHPLARHAAVRRETERRKHSSQSGGSSLLLELSSLAPPAVHHRLAQLFATPRLFNLTVTSMRGLERPLRVGRARLREVRALVPLAQGHRLGIAIVSHGAATTYGVIADRDTVPDLDRFAAALREEHAELRRAARRRNAAMRRGGPAIASALEGVPD